MYSEESLAYCSGQCQASRSPPVLCRCVCGGRNHGTLQRGRVIDVRQAKTHDQRFAEWMERTAPRPEPKPLPEMKQLPYLTRPKTVEEKKRDVQRMPEVRAYHASGKLLKKVGSSFKHALAGYSQDELNEKIVKGLRFFLNQENTDKAIDQAFTIRQSHQPNANRPELYELYETGEIDQALEMMGKRWVIGRPKLKH